MILDMPSASIDIGIEKFVKWYKNYNKIKWIFKIGIIGLGYVGLPLAVEFAKYKVVGFDINKSRIDELTNFNDSTLEITVIFKGCNYKIS